MLAEWSDPNNAAERIYLYDHDLNMKTHHQRHREYSRSCLIHGRSHGRSLLCWMKDFIAVYVFTQEH
jgi:hypothetical protein